jgi:hypothetical protein
MRARRAVRIYPEFTNFKFNLSKAFFQTGKKHEEGAFFKRRGKTKYTKRDKKYYNYCSSFTTITRDF